MSNSFVLSQAGHREVLELLLQGRTITEIADMLGVSRTTIYNRRKDFLDYAKKEGVCLAAEHFGVEDTFEKLSNLSHLLEASGLEVEDARRGVEVVNLLSSFDAVDSVAFIEDVMRRAVELGISGDEIVGYASELRGLEVSEGKPYSSLVDEIGERRAEYHRLEGELGDLREKISGDRESLENQLKESGVTREKLDAFVEEREVLESHGIGLDDVDRLETLVINLRQHDYDLGEVLGFYEKMVLLRESIGAKRDESGRLENKNNELKRENDQLESQLSRNLGLLSVVKSFEKTGVDSEDLLEVVRIVSDMSQGLGVSGEEAFTRFVDDVRTLYVERNDYRMQVEELRELQRVYQAKINLVKEELEVLEEVVSDRRSTVEAMRGFEALDITGDDLVMWSTLVKALGYEVKGFHGVLEELGGLSEYVEVKTKEIRLLEEKRDVLAGEVSGFEARIQGLGESLSLLQESFAEEAARIRGAVDEFDMYFTSPGDGFKARSREILDEVTGDLRGLLSETRSMWGDDLGKLDENVERILGESERILQNAYRGGRIVGQFHSLEPISKILREEEVSRVEGTISVITMLTYIQGWLRKTRMDEREVFGDLIKELMGDLGDIY